MSEKRVYSLSKLTQSIENVINAHCNTIVWIRAEIVKLNYYSKTGHCYPALVEKKDGRVIAELRGNIWNANFQKINNKFKSVLKEELKDDMTVVIRGSVTFHPVHGLALNIIDIDPHYTLGELAREKAESIEKLKAEKIFDANRKTILPKLPKTIAIISIDTSKGYQDFIDVIENNPWGFKFHHLLFPAILQGERAVTTIIEQLERIEAFSEAFDAVAIIRGGGGEIGLSCFDNYSLARKIATFPLPVLTGIGHSSNETVSELVSFQSFITPTKIAEFLLQNFQEFALSLKEHEDKLAKESSWMFSQQKTSLNETARLFNSLARGSFDKSKSILNQLSASLVSESKSLLRREKEDLKDIAKGLQSATVSIRRQQHFLQQIANKLENQHHLILMDQQNEMARFQQVLLNSQKNILGEAQRDLIFAEEKIRMLSPENILKRGFSITRHNGKAISTIEQLEPNEVIETQLYSGRVSSRIENLKKTIEND